jgi:predicted dehydrogenase
MRFAIVGCGYVADYYLATLGNHAGLELVGAYDRNPVRARAFTSFHGLRRYDSLEELLGDERVQLVANLTNPSSHFEVSRAALEAGKHVYSEKPLSTRLEEAEQLVAQAERRGLLLASAPCSVLGETAQTIWKALRDGSIGAPRLVYAELDDGPVPVLDHSSWTSASGAPWPARDEFEVGCTMEHAGYYVTWLTAFFGPVQRLSAFSHVVVPDKGIPVSVVTPDFAVASLEFAGGVVARITCSIFADHDHRLRIFGDAGVLSTDQAWNYGAPVRLARRSRLALRAGRHPTLARLAGLGPRHVRLVRPAQLRHGRRLPNRMDFCRGMAELADSLREGRPPRLSARWSLHVNELVLAMQHPEIYGAPRQIRSTFEPLAPMPWAT